MLSRNFMGFPDCEYHHPSTPPSPPLPSAFHATHTGHGPSTPACPWRRRARPRTCATRTRPVRVCLYLVLAEWMWTCGFLPSSLSLNALNSSLQPQTHKPTKSLAGNYLCHVPASDFVAASLPPLTFRLRQQPDQSSGELPSLLTLPLSDLVLEVCVSARG
jgi:hypothetical protein